MAQGDTPDSKKETLVADGTAQITNITISVDGVTGDRQC